MLNFLESLLARDLYAEFTALLFLNLILLRPPPYSAQKMCAQQYLEQFRWGRLPFDLFALVNSLHRSVRSGVDSNQEKWNSSSAEDDEAQRTRLALEYIDLGCRGREVSGIVSKRGCLVS